MRRALVLCIVAAAVLLAQTAAPLIPVWLGNHYQWVRLGQGLTLNGDVLSAQVSPRRVYGVQLLPTPQGAYQAPTGARGVALWLNGLRQAVGVDYELTSAGEIKPLWPWPAGVVLIDYDPE